MFDNLFSKLNSNTSEFVGISLNASGLLEVAQINRADKEVIKYTNRQVTYNSINREIQDYDTMRVEIESALEELSLNPKNCNITLALPDVLFGITDLPDLLEGEQVNEALMVDIQESYIFKNADPIISWTKVREIGDTQRIAYTAIQEMALHQIKSIFTTLGANLICVQTSFSALMSGLNFSDKLSQITPADGTGWNILLITAKSFSIYNFASSGLNNYYEEPLAVKSFSGEEIYTTIPSMVASALQNYTATTLLVISETDDVSAQVVATKLSSEAYYAGKNYNSYFIEQNKYQERPPIGVSLDILQSLSAQISTSVIGTAIEHAEGNPLKFNFLATKGAGISATTSDLITIGNKTYELTLPKVQKLSGIVCAIVLVICGLLYGILKSTTDKLNSELNELVQKEQTLQAELKANDNKPVVANLSTSMDTITKTNRKKMLYYDALSYGIPDNLWIEHFYAGTGGAIAIDGAALESSDITAFLRGIREVAGESEVSVTKLTVLGSDELLDSSAPEIYSFQLANQSYKASPTNVATKQAKSTSKQNIPSAKMPSKIPPVIPAN